MAPRLLPAPLLTAFVAALALAGCTTDEGGSGGGAAAGEGSASAYVKDAPSDDFREVHVVFTEVAVHRSGAGAEPTTTAVGTATGVSTTVGNTTVTASATASATGSTDPTNGTGDPAGWIVLFQDPSGVDVDLLNTTGARAAFLGEADLDAGHYQQVRITVTEAYGITHDGEREEIAVSSGTLRSVRSFTVEGGRETRITIDIDLEKSLRQQGNGEWRMTPVIGKTTAQVVEDSSSGEETAEPGDVEEVPEAGDGTTASASATVTGSASATTSTSASTSTTDAP